MSRLKELRANPIVDGIITIASAILIAYVVQLLIVKPYRIPSESMVPTLAIGDRVITARFLLRFRDPERGEVFVFHPNGKGTDVFQPAQGEVSASSENYVKRVVGLPDETIGSLRGKVYTCKGNRVDTAIVNGELNTSRVLVPERAVRARPADHHLPGLGRRAADLHRAEALPDAGRQPGELGRRPVLGPDPARPADRTGVHDVLAAVPVLVPLSR